MGTGEHWRHFSDVMSRGFSGSTDEESRGEDTNCLGSGINCEITDCHC